MTTTIRYIDDDHDIFQISIDTSSQIVEVSNKYDVSMRKIILSAEEINWFVDYLRTKSIFLLPQIVDALLSFDLVWSDVKQELIKL